MAPAAGFSSPNTLQSGLPHAVPTMSTSDGKWTARREDPNSKLQAPEKHQASSSNRGLHAWFWCLVFEDSLVFGAWRLKLPRGTAVAGREACWRWRSVLWPWWPDDGQLITSPPGKGDSVIRTNTGSTSGPRRGKAPTTPRVETRVKKAPNFKLQTSEKPQPSNTKLAGQDSQPRCVKWRLKVGVWSLGFFWSLEFGIWDFVRACRIGRA